MSDVDTTCALCGRGLAYEDALEVLLPEGDVESYCYDGCPTDVPSEEPRGSSVSLGSLLTAFDRGELSERAVSFLLAMLVLDFWETYWSLPAVRSPV